MLEVCRLLYLYSLEIGTYEICPSILVIEPGDGPILGVAIHDVDIGPACRDHIFSVAAGCRVPIKAGDSAATQAVGRSAPAIVVLQAAAEIVRSLIVLGDRVELLDW